MPDTIPPLHCIERAFRDFISDPRFPCLAAKGVVNAGGYTLRSYGRMGSPEAAAQLGRELAAFLEHTSGHRAALRTFVAVFPGTDVADEQVFEQLLWKQLQGLHEQDAERNAWAAGASDDPDDPGFSFSYHSSALFVVGLHPASSRLARAFRWPTLVFNPHEQFQRLREAQKFDRLRGMVREREVALQGSLNPNLADFGERSEARQYSGRRTEEEWRCPFHRVSTP